MDEFLLTGIQSKDILGYWPLVQPLLEKSFAGSADKFEPLQFLNDLIDHKLQLWIAHDTKKVRGALVTQLDKQEHETSCMVLTIAGDGMRCSNNKSLWHQIKDWARSNGATAIYAHSTPSRIRLWRQLDLGFQDTGEQHGTQKKIRLSLKGNNGSENI